nr:unnamed protein product [Callosobruchus analis]
MHWYNELSSDGESSVDDEDDDELEEDVIQHSDHNTDSEEEIEDNDLGQNTNESSSADFYLGKDKNTKWSRLRPNIQVRTRAHNIVKLLPGPKGTARIAKSEIECFNLYLDENIIRTIVVCTNMYIDKVRAKYDRETDAKQTNEMEIRALFGILLQIGVLRSSRQDAHQMWDNSKGSGRELCYLAMSEKRFYFLLRCLRFVNINDRSQTTKTDKMAHIRDVFQLFIGNFQKNFIAGEYLTVDEQLLAFRGRCSFKQYIPSKPARYGIT